MPDIPQLVAAIDDRLAEIAAEIGALDAAKARLVAPGAGGAGVTERVVAPSRRPTARGRLMPAPEPPDPVAGGRAPERVSAARDGGLAETSQRVTRRRAARVRRPGAGGGVVGSETLERLLAETSSGLSANAIAQQAGVGYARTLKLLHELEAAGQVRRSGARRSTVWQLITDEERIAQRAAELERLRIAPSRRRGRARAS